MLVVVLYHAHVPGFAGGFVGIDVFFVISGYVIGSSLCRELESPGGAELRPLYVRRVRRLLPALLAMVVGTMILTTLFLEIGAAQVEAARSGVAATFSFANLYLLWGGDRYFAPDVETNPFLHTRSLGVEEQFYLMAPLLFALSAVLAPRTRWASIGVVRAILLGLSVGSLLLSITLVGTGELDRAFFSPLPRCWEMGAGMVLATVRRLELDAIVDPLTTALGRGGRSRTTTGDAERARSAVTQRIRSSIKRIEEHHQGLGQHLRHSLLTGTFCRSHPEHPTTWTVSR